MRRFALVLALLCATAQADDAALRFRSVDGADGVPLNVVEAGDPARPGIVFVHGIGQSYLSYENQLHSALAAEFHLVAFDLRGHGNSGKPWTREAYVDSVKWAEDLRRVMAATGLTRPVLLGWSYGTLVVADYVRHVGVSNVSGIVLVSSLGGFSPPPPPLPAAIAATMASGRARRDGPDLEANIASALETAHQLTAKTMPPQWIERATIIGMMLPASAHHFMQQRSLDNQDLVPKLTVPVLVVLGSKDLGTPESVARRFTSGLAHASTSVYPEAGHSAFAEEPDRFNRELAEFARRASP
jgi:pimeloyl-ACP methyl ester carboxylesterase